MAENMVDTKLAFPNDFDLKETPGFDDVLMIYDASTGKVKQTKMESVLSASAASIIDTATPSSSPTGEETSGQSYRVSNTTNEDQEFTNFLDSNGDPIIVPSKENGLITLNTNGGWVFIRGADTADMTLNGGYSGTAADLHAESLKHDDIGYTGDGNPNLASEAPRTPGKYIASNGSEGTAATAEYITISINPTNPKLVIGNFNPGSVQKFYTLNTTPTITNGPLSNTTNVIDIGNATQIKFTTKLGAGDVGNPDVIVQYGTEIILPEAISIDGNPIKNADLELYTKEESDDKYATKESVSILSSSVQPLLNAIHISESASTNLLDPILDQPVGLINTVNGSITTTGLSTQYSVTNLLPVPKNTTYSLLNQSHPGFAARNAAFYYVIDGTWHSSVDGWLNDVVVPNVDGLAVRFSIPNETNSLYPTAASDIGIFAGTSPVWEPFLSGTLVTLPFDTVSTGSKPDKAIATISDVKTLMGGAGQSPSTVEYDLSESGTLTVTYPEGTLAGYTRNNRGNTGNDMFNFAPYNIKGVTANPNDDIAPMHEQGPSTGAAIPIGGNHGIACGQFTAAGHGLTNTDRGSAWTQGANTYYLMLIVNANTLIFLSQNTGTVANPSFSALNNGTITRVSNGSTLTLSGKVATQLWPTIKGLQSKVLINGVSEVEEGAGTARFIDVVESYDIKLIASMLQTIIDNPGTSDLTFPADSSAHIKNIYRFLPNMAVLVFAEFRKLYETQWGDWMASQAIPIGPLNETEFYIPNSNILNASVDLRKPKVIAWSSSIPLTYIINANQPEPNNPPNRIIQYYNNVGFMFGYLPGVGVSNNLNDYTSRTAEIRNNTAKMYLHPAESSKISDPLPVNTTLNVGIMRVFTDLTKTRIGNRLSCFNFPNNDIEYVFLDYEGDMYDTVDLYNAFLNGKKITVIESRNAEVLTDTYQDGFPVNATYVEGETCYIVLEIK